MVTSLLLVERELRGKQVVGVAASSPPRYIAPRLEQPWKVTEVAAHGSRFGADPLVHTEERTHDPNWAWSPGTVRVTGPEPALT